VTGTFVISIDFELMWGVHDRLTIADYGKNVLGGRQSIPFILSLFEKYGVRATWACVGAMFASSIEELFEYYPVCAQNQVDVPGSIRASMNVYSLGRSEKDDPYHYAPSLLRLISGSFGQEIATHTYTHFACFDRPQSSSTFASDVQSSLNIAKKYNSRIKSIVFPRNQIPSSYLGVLPSLGITHFRGLDSLDRFYASNRRLIPFIMHRACRIYDSVLPGVGTIRNNPSAHGNDLVNVSASRFLRPLTKSSLYNKLHLIRIKSEILEAAKANRVYHLWFHPHNFGHDLSSSLQRLESILQFFLECKNKYGMRSSCMSDFVVSCP